MWILSQNKKKLINANLTRSIDLEIRGNVGQIVANNKSIPEELGEYRVYAAEAIMNEIALFTAQNNVYIMPEEHEANEKYKGEQSNGQ